MKLNFASGDFKRYVFPYLNSNMYVFTENDNALIIDPIVCDEAFSYLETLHIKNVLILLTHEHFDHTNGINSFKKLFNARLICQKNALLPKNQKFSNRPAILSLVLMDKGMDEEAKQCEEIFQPYTYDADVSFDEEFTTEWQSHKITMKSIQGHSPASCLIIIDEENYFTGDSLIPDTEVITKLPGGNKEIYYSATLPRLMEIPASATIFPGHGKPVKMNNLAFSGNRFVVIK